MENMKTTIAQENNIPSKFDKFLEIFLFIHHYITFPTLVAFSLVRLLTKNS